MAAIVELQATVAVPLFVMLAGEIAPQDRLAGTVSVKETTPVNPFRAAIVIVEVAETPAFTAAGEVAVMLKSVTVKVAVAEWLRLPLVPVMLSV